MSGPLRFPACGRPGGMRALGPHASYLVLFIAASAVLKGAGWLVEAVDGLACRHGLSRLLAGATILAAATSAPEAVLAVRASLLGQPDLAASLVVGACAVNVGLILGLGLLACGQFPAGASVAKQGLLISGLALLVSAFARDGLFSRPEGAALIGMACIGGLVCWRAWLSGRWRTGAAARNAASAMDLAPRLFLGALLLGLGSRYVVAGGTAVASQLGLAPAVAGLTTVSIGTSVPEAIAAAAAVRRGLRDLALGCLVGSTALNLTAVLGLASTVRPGVHAYGTALLHLPLVVLLGLLLAGFGAMCRTLGRAEGAAILAVYIAYLWLAFA